MSTSRSTAASAPKRKKNATGSRSDEGWLHGVDVDKNARKVKCKYCSKTYSGGIYRFKHHLAGTRENVEACLSVPDEVRNRFLELIDLHLDAKEKKKKSFHDSGSSVQETEPQTSIVQPSTSMGKNVQFKGFTQATVSQLLKKDVRKSACKKIAKWFYSSAIPFNAIKNPAFAEMCAEIARHGPGFKPPSYHEIRETLLNEEMQEMQARLQVYKAEWKKVGCTIMSDGWTDKKRRSICNFLVNSPKGTVFLESIDTSSFSKTAEKVFEMLDNIVEKVGEENVVQIVTDNAAAYKAAGEKLMEKRKNLFWTPCAAHCIDLMLEDLEKHLKIHKTTISKGRKITTYIYSRTMLISMLKEFTHGRDLIRPAVTRFATAYLTLGCLSELKIELMAMFSSQTWKRSKFFNTAEGKRVQGIVLDHRFWNSTLTCLKAALPLIKVLRLVDSDEKPAMPFLYIEMNAAKEKIQSNFNNVLRRYQPILKIIDERWANQLYRPLHAAAYYLNPKIHYNPDFDMNDKWVTDGLFDCLGRLVKEQNERFKIIAQLDTFHHARGTFSRDGATAMLEIKHPADWWRTYGDEVPELQRFAIRVLSLTCSSSGCERNWSAFEMVHTKKRNRLHQKKMNDLVFVMYNMKLVDRQVRSIELPSFDDINSDDDWITDRSVADTVDEDVDQEFGSEGATTTSTPLELHDEPSDHGGDGDQEIEEEVNFEENDVNDNIDIDEDDLSNDDGGDDDSDDGNTNVDINDLS